MDRSLVWLVTRKTAKYSFAVATGLSAALYWTPDQTKTEFADFLKSAGARAMDVSKDEFAQRVDNMKPDIDFKLTLPRLNEKGPTFVSKKDINVLGKTAEGILNSNDDTPDKWYAEMGRYQSLMSDRDNRLAMKKWMSQFDHLKGKPIAEMAKAVDAEIDKAITYVTDPVNYGRRDYWATPIETIARGKGDCEDFAILKQEVLRYLGVPEDKLYVVAVSAEGGKDLNHATLLVDINEPSMMRDAWETMKGWVGFKTEDHQFVILDNDGSEEGRLIEQDKSKFTPFYAMNKNGFWAVPKDNVFKWPLK